MQRAFSLAIFQLVVISASASAQGVANQRPHLQLPPSYGATVMSTIIEAQANYIAAAGDFLESGANARLTDAIAADKELDNAVKWVSTYFERKEVNRRYTKQPSYLERQATNQAVTKGLITSNFQVELKGDVSDKLNWMLRELAASAPAHRFEQGNVETFLDTAADRKLLPSDLSRIRFTDGGRRNGKAVVFSADSADATKNQWPRALRDPLLDQARTKFEWVREDALTELKTTRELSHATGQRLMESMDALCAEFNAAYPTSRRRESAGSYWEYAAGKKFLQTLALSVFRLMQTEDLRAFDGSYQFNGESVAGLVGHMHTYGLEFAPAEPGGEKVYEKIFLAMRQFYQQVSGE